MLQQTQVARVIEFYPRFLQRYPTLEDLASAPGDEVRESWEGLGYYARARNLHAAVRRIVAESGGRVPQSPVELARLPGIGAYTAGAVASLAFGAAVPAVDTNVARVLGRVFGLRGAAQGSRRMRRVWVLAAALVPPRRAADWNQALMDLGALVCTARAPRCPACPVRGVCATRPRVEQRGRAVAARAFPRSGALRSPRT
jgi:A/G-specific adenine glycosylase